MKLRLLLERLGHKINEPVFDQVIKYFSLCQKHGKLPGRFKLTLQDNVNFNYSVFINIMYIDNSSILYVIDGATRYWAAK